MHFNYDDLDPYAFDAYCKPTLDRLIPEMSESRRNGRSDELIEFHTKLGLAAEFYLITEHDYTEDTFEFRDVISPDGTSREIKTIADLTKIPNILMDMYKKKGWYGDEVSDEIMIFQRDKKEYQLHSFYTWDGNKYVQSDINSV